MFADIETKNDCIPKKRVRKAQEEEKQSQWRGGIVICR